MNDMNSFQQRAEIISNQIINNTTILDIGTGDGNILKILRQMKLKLLLQTSQLSQSHF